MVAVTVGMLLFPQASKVQAVEGTGQNQKTLPFSDDFSSYGLGQEAPFGAWRLGGANDPGHIEQQVQSDNKLGNVYHCNAGGTLSSIYLPTDWKDYALEVDWRHGEPRIYFRLSGEGKSGYYVTKGLGYSSRVELHKFALGSDQVIAESSGYDTPGGVWHRWRIEVIGANIRVFINNNKLIDIVDEDPSLAAGGVGLGGGDNFDNVRVEPISSTP